MQIHIDVHLHSYKNIHIYIYIYVYVYAHTFTYTCITHINTCILQWNGSVSIGMCTRLSTPFSRSIIRSRAHSIFPSCLLSWPVSLLSRSLSLSPHTRSSSHPLFLTPALSGSYSHALPLSRTLSLTLSLSLLISRADASSVLQRIVVCCSVLQCVAAVMMCGNLSNRRQQCLQCVEALCNVLQSVAACFSVLQCVAVRCSALQRAHVIYIQMRMIRGGSSVLVFVAVSCSVLQCR